MNGRIAESGLASDVTSGIVSRRNTLLAILIPEASDDIGQRGSIQVYINILRRMVHSNGCLNLKYRESGCRLR